MVLPLIVLPLKFFVFSVVPKTSHMINKKNIIALIPARGGSKSVPGKNIYPLAGKPLIAYSIETALKVKEIDRVIVSTDDDEIGAIAKKYGAEHYKRPAHLATDHALVVDTIEYMIELLTNEGEQPGILILLEPTCPFRSVETVSKCIVMITNDDTPYDSVATYTEAELNPHRAWKINGHSPEPFIPATNPWLPRQKLPKAYQLNGAVYAFNVNAFKKRGDSPGLLFGKTGAVVIDKNEAVDIDDEIDFKVAEVMLAET